jgi:hypothetical protein
MVLLVHGNDTSEDLEGNGYCDAVVMKTLQAGDVNFVIGNCDRERSNGVSTCYSSLK